MHFQKNALFKTRYSRIPCHMHLRITTQPRSVTVEKMAGIFTKRIRQPQVQWSWNAFPTHCDTLQSHRCASDTQIRIASQANSETGRSSVKILAGECSLYSNYLVQFSFFFGMGTPCRNVSLLPIPMNTASQLANTHRRF